MTAPHVDRIDRKALSRKGLWTHMGRREASPVNQRIDIRIVRLQCPAWGTKSRKSEFDRKRRSV